MDRFSPNFSRPIGVTASERALKRSCDRSFLSLWSHASVFRDQGNGGGGEGKEICDVLVVFGNHVLIFSDKHCVFPSSGDVLLDWRRWYRNAIADSAKQIYGAERWLKTHPDRVFRDRKCTRRLPVSLPPAANAIFHRIIVAHGSGPACASHFHGGSGSLILNSELIGVDPAMPFAVGFVDNSCRLVHILDDTTFELLLSALDTITDFTDYLAEKEALFTSRTLVMATGEEELLGRYLRLVDPSTGKHSFKFPSDVDGVFLEEGEWHAFATSSAAISQQRADEVS